MRTRSRSRIFKIPGIDILYYKMILPGDWSKMITQDPRPPDEPSPPSSQTSEEKQ